jgi:hypothetical protein
MSLKIIFLKILDANSNIIVSIGEKLVFLIMIIKPKSTSSNNELPRRSRRESQQLQ